MISAPQMHSPWPLRVCAIIVETGGGGCFIAKRLVYNAIIENIFDVSFLVKFLIFFAHLFRHLSHYFRSYSGPIFLSNIVLHKTFSFYVDFQT